MISMAIVVMLLGYYCAIAVTMSLLSLCLYSRRGFTVVVALAERAFHIVLSLAWSCFLHCILVTRDFITTKVAVTN